MDSVMIARLLDGAVKAAGVPIVGVSIGTQADRTTWTVQPAALQGAAQPTINAFNADDPAYATADLDTAVKGNLDVDRIFSAIVWTILDTYSAPATIAKYTAARTKIISVYKSQPWKP